MSEQHHQKLSKPHRASTSSCCEHIFQLKHCCISPLQDKFTKLLLVMPEIHQMASRGEDHLYQKHRSGGAPTQTLLMEMLHAKRK